MRLIASPDGRDRSVTIYQDAYIYASILEDSAEVTHTISQNRYAWIQVARGSVLIGDRLLKAGDAISSDQVGDLQLTGKGNAEILVFDLA